MSLEQEKEDLRQHEGDVRTLRQELETAYRERLALIAETKLMAAEKLEAQRERHEIEAAYREMSTAKEAAYKTELEKVRGDAERLRSELEERTQQLQSEFKERTERLQSDLEGCRTALSQMLASRSWKLTEPLRMVARAIKRVRS